MITRKHRPLMWAAVVGLAAVLAMLGGTAALAAQGYSDVPADGLFHDQIMALTGLQIAAGFPDGSFKPDDPVTRQQFAKMIVLATDTHTEAVDNEADPTFSDVVPSMGLPYPFDYIEEAVEAGFIKGDQGKFNPTHNITRVQLALIIARASGSALPAPPVGYQTGFSDVPDYAADEVAKAKFNGILDGTTATTFDPYSNATRGQVSKMVVELLTLLVPAANGSCISCHGSASLAMDVGTEKVPLYVDAAAYAANEHGLVRCGKCHTNMNPVPPHDATRIYGSWARFSAKDTDTTKTRNFYSVTADACVRCHTDARYKAFPQSEHGTIKDLKYNWDGSPRVEVMVAGSDGQQYATNENYDAKDCGRCHINTNCGTCHWKSEVTQKAVGNVLDLWNQYDSAANDIKKQQTEYAMDWTVNVAAHDFVGPAELTSSNAACTPCHVGYYQGDKSVPAINLYGKGISRHPQTQELLLSGQRGVHETKQVCTDCHKEVHEAVYENTADGRRVGGQTKCEDCHADKVTATHKDVACIACHDAELGVHRDSTGEVYPYALKHNVEESWPSHNLTKDVQCAKCHYAGNPLGAPPSVTPFAIH
ncbi:MAG: hypothetical protein Kow00129_17030 [Thermoleophilia bacterium]